MMTWTSQTRGRGYSTVVRLHRFTRELRSKTVKTQPLILEETIYWWAVFPIHSITSVRVNLSISHGKQPSNLTTLKSSNLASGKTILIRTEHWQSKQGREIAFRSITAP